MADPVSKVGIELFKQRLFPFQFVKEKRSIMDKNTVFKVGKILGLATAVGVAVYSKMKKKAPQEEIIDIEPEVIEEPQK